MKSKKFLAVVSAMALLGVGASCENVNILNDFTVSVSAEELTLENGLKYEVNEDGTEITITGCDTTVTEVVIPAEIDSLPVTNIGKDSFRGFELLTSVTIPDSVTSIGECAFYGCKSLTSLEIPDSVTSIGIYAFFDCALLTSVTIPDSVTFIRWGAFYDCISLTSVTIPDSITSVEMYTFYNCKSLTSVTIPKSVTSIGERAFSGCKSLTDVYFQGTEKEWKNIEVDNKFGYNQCLLSANIHFVSNSENPTVEPTLPGDANGDTIFDVRDVTTVNQYIIKAVDFDEQAIANADVIKDSIVDVSDLGQMKKFIIKLIDKF